MRRVGRLGLPALGVPVPRTLSSGAPGVCAFMAAHAAIAAALHQSVDRRLRRQVTGCGAASVKSPDVQAVNTMLGNLKTAVSGTHHAVGFAKYSHRYLAQVQYVFNRRLNLRTSLRRLI